MSTLRDRLIALADANDDAMQGTDWAAHKMRYVVFAAARMALEDAVATCHALPTDDWREDERAAETAYSHAISALRDGLEP